MQVDEFKQAVKDRYLELYPSIVDYIEQFITVEFLDLHEDAFAQNFYFWSINMNIEGSTGEYTYYSSLDAAKTGWRNNSNQLKNWLLTRALWLKNEWS